MDKTIEIACTEYACRKCLDGKLYAYGRRSSSPHKCRVCGRRLAMVSRLTKRELEELARTREVTVEVRTVEMTNVVEF